MEGLIFGGADQYVTFEATFIYLHPLLCHLLKHRT